jgi:hypothetical protein
VKELQLLGERLRSWFKGGDPQTGWENDGKTMGKQKFIYGYGDGPKPTIYIYYILYIYTL